MQYCVDWPRHETLSGELRVAIFSAEDGRNLFRQLHAMFKTEKLLDAIATASKASQDGKLTMADCEDIEATMVEISSRRKLSETKALRPTELC